MHTLDAIDRATRILRTRALEDSSPTDPTCERRHPRLRNAIIRATVPSSARRLQTVPRLAQSVMQHGANPCTYELTVGSDPAFVFYRVPGVADDEILDVFEDSEVQFAAYRSSDVTLPNILAGGHFSFAFVRHPRTRLAHCWRTNVLETNGLDLPREVRTELHDFAAFVDYVGGLDLATCAPALRLQTELVDFDHVDFVGRFENLDDDFAVVCDVLEMLPVELAWRVAEVDDDDTGDTAEIREKVARMYAADMRAFGYSSG